MNEYAPGQAEKKLTQLDTDTLPQIPDRLTFAKARFCYTL
jgi:hypothetical protein